MNTNVNRILPIFLLPIAASLACGLVDDITQPAPTLAPPPTLLQPDTTPSPSDATEDSSSSLQATPTLALTPVEGEPPATDLDPPPEDLVELEQWLLEAQTVAADIDEVCSLLQQAEWQLTDDSCASVDLNDDETEEWLLTLDTTRIAPDGVATLEGHPGDFWVIGQERILFQTFGPDELDFFAAAPQIVSVEDMSGDEQPEVVLVFTTCGAHTCFNSYQILSTHNGDLANVVEPDADNDGVEGPDVISLSFVDSEILADETGDDLPDLVISGGLIGSAGAGIQRPRTEIWAWDGTAISLAEQQWEDTGYRFHTLYNANYAFDQQAYDEARNLYEAVVIDTSLEDTGWADTSADEIRAVTRQFAAFRLSLLPLLRGDITEATRWRNWLESEYGQTPMARAASVLVTEWERNGNDLPAACEVSTALLEAEPNPTGQLTDMGYNNPSLDAASVCPIE